MDVQHREPSDNADQAQGGRIAPAKPKAIPGLDPTNYQAKKSIACRLSSVEA
jgi:hypothetical protein